MRITLSPVELEEARAEAHTRHRSALARRAQQTYGAQPENSLAYKLIGCTGERSLVQWTGLRWTAQDGPSAPADVGRFLEIRTRPRRFRPQYLPLHKPADENGKPYVLAVITGLATVELLGWITGRDGILERYYGAPMDPDRPAYCVPESDLQPMRTLRDELAPELHRWTGERPCHCVP